MYILLDFRVSLFRWAGISQFQTGNDFWIKKSRRRVARITKWINQQTGKFFLHVFLGIFNLEFFRNYFQYNRKKYQLRYMQTKVGSLKILNQFKLLENKMFKIKNIKQNTSTIKFNFYLTEKSKQILVLKSWL